jgi:hypothetical protein
VLLRASVYIYAPTAHVEVGEGVTVLELCTAGECVPFHIGSSQLQCEVRPVETSMTD